MIRHMPRSGWVWLGLGAAYFFIPLAATLEFSLKEANGYGLSSYRQILDDPQFRDLLWVSFKLALGTIVVSLLIFIPGVYWVHLRVPRLRPLVEFLSVLPFVVPPIVLIVGLLYVYNVNWVPIWFLESTRFLVPGYVVLSFPFMFRALDVSFRSIDVHTLTEASQSLGASWRTTLTRVILPNIRVAALAGSFLTLAIVMGEFTIASLAAFKTFPTYIQLVNETQPYEAAALSLLSFLIVWAAMLALLFVGRGRPRPAGAATR